MYIDLLKSTPAPQKSTQPRALIIEDDITTEPIWEHVLKLVNQQMTYEWVNNATEAEFLIRRSFRENKPYDVVISDIFLSSSKTGLDLWYQFGSALKGKMLLISGISYNKLTKMASEKTPCPLYIQKPLNINECVEAVYGLLSYQR
jgi:DNA-binding NtrC family response regulator